MYYYFPVSGNPQKITNKEAVSKMKNISSQWEDEETTYGTLWMGVFDWASSKQGNVFKVDIPNLKTGGSIPKNVIASSFFGFDIYGKCFLEPISHPN